MFNLIWGIEIKFVMIEINPDLSWDYEGMISQLNCQYKIEMKDIGKIYHISEKTLNWAMIFKKCIYFTKIYFHDFEIRKIWAISRISLLFNLIIIRENLKIVLCSHFISNFGRWRDHFPSVYLCIHTYITYVRFNLHGWWNYSYEY